MGRSNDTPEHPSLKSNVDDKKNLVLKGLKKRKISKLH